MGEGGAVIHWYAHRFASIPTEEVVGIYRRKSTLKCPKAEELAFKNTRSLSTREHTRTIQGRCAASPTSRERRSEPRGKIRISKVLSPLFIGA